MSRKRLASPANDTIGTYGHLRFSIFQAVAVYDTRLSPGNVRTLAALGSHATAEHGYWCWPEVSTLADRLGVTVQRVRQSIAKLEACGYIEVCERYDDAEGASGRQLANGYRLIMDYEIDEKHRRCNTERQRKGVGGRPTHHTPRNSEFLGEGQLGVSGEGQLGVSGEGQLGVSGEGQLGVSPSESENKKRRRKAENGSAGAVALPLEVETSAEPSAEPSPPPAPRRPPPCGISHPGHRDRVA